ncbi:hypothetical protein EYZ11_001254 [Aspergillus tanneri]|uniref:Kinetochore protein Sos7 coiled-coil domain-containing protein n=1 Tax=Aspergillus tanneri TaxID=1220188 RepID=A0A4S3JV29_9EURO|nr:uncharacterized protein ATNIH1004_007142 [Aspergillus tanneri]KAA8645723.1 hypothetical protein ATNIH1004_007142 [Aspergillus tanneri]THC99255.1 hypothetical protein EYZ11_001254 [Aspergillus tanneri]
MTELSHTTALEKLHRMEQQDGSLDTHLAIVRISEPIFSPDGSSAPTPSKRNSDVSTIDNPSPVSLDADLTHYKELFSKLRFSYVEQVTKEKFLRAIVGDPPLVVGHNENVELEAQLAEVKAELRAQKEEVRVMIEEMEKTGRDLSRRYKNVQLQMTQLSTLPESIENLESTIAGLRAKRIATMDLSSSQNMPLPATLSLLSEREAELSALDRQLAAVQNTLPRKTREAETIERELGVLGKRKSEAITQAQEAKRKKQEGESDGLEEMGRWYRSAGEALKGLVGVGG